MPNIISIFTSKKKRKYSAFLITMIAVLTVVIIYAQLAIVAVYDENYTLRRMDNIHSRQLNRLFEENNRTLNDTSRMNILAFMVFQDNTDKHEYIPDVYVCRHFAYDFVANATVAGLRCGYVTLRFENGGSHAVVAFNTTRYGTVFIEPQDDYFVDVKIGIEYYKGTVITDYDIVWNDDFLKK